MGKKRKSKPMRPWCWYCEKDFEDDKVLVTHQRAKHFKCEECNKKLTTAGGMVVHAQQVHKISIYKVPNAIAGRDNLDVEIFGMEGIPEEDMIAHELRIQQQNQSKKAKASSGAAHGAYGELSLEQIQQQLAAHKAHVTTAPTPAPTATAAPAVNTVPAAIAPPVIYPPQANYYGYSYNGYPPVYNAGYYQQGFPPPAMPAMPYGYHATPIPTTSSSMVVPPPPPPPSHLQPWGYNTSQPDNTYVVPQQQPEAPQVVSLPTPSTSHITSPTAVKTPAATKSTSVSPPPQTGEKSIGKKKASKVILIYNNNDISPEEQRAQLEKYLVRDEVK